MLHTLPTHCPLRHVLLSSSHKVESGRDSGSGQMGLRPWQRAARAHSVAGAHSVSRVTKRHCELQQRPSLGEHSAPATRLQPRRPSGSLGGTQHGSEHCSASPQSQASKPSTIPCIYNNNRII